MGFRPSKNAIILLTVYDFTHTNALFAHLFLTTSASTGPPLPQNPSTVTSPLITTTDSPLSTFLSLTSFILHHAHRSSRSTTYALLSLLTIRLLTESPQLCKLLCSAQPDNLINPRLCRQRAPFLPLPPTKAKGRRIPAEAILDICIDGINHNLRLRLDVGLYTAMLNPIHQIIAHLAMVKKGHEMGPYHWDILWQSLLSLLRFVNTYSSALSQQNSGATIKAMLEPLLASFALAVYHGESVLPVHSTYDDLVYKLVEVGPELFENIGRVFVPGGTTTTIATSAPVSSSDKDRSILGRSTDILLALTRHFHGLLPASSRTAPSSSASSHPTSTTSSTTTTPPPATPPLFPREVLKLIKKGYESMRLPSAEGIERWEKWRENEGGAGNNKALVKKIGRVIVEDARRTER